MRTFVCTILFLCLAFAGFAFEPPAMQCIAIHDNTHLKVYWKNPANAANLQIKTYYFYCNDILVDSIVTTATYHPYDFGDKVISMAGSTSTFACFIVAQNNANELAYSDTIRTLELQVTTRTVNLQNGDIGVDAELTWQSPMAQLDNNWGSKFYIYKRRAFENSFTISDSVANTVNTYLDLADVCENTIDYAIGIDHKYYIPLIDGSQSQRNCQFMSSNKQATVIDHTEPRMPILDSVSYLENNQIQLGFHSQDPYMKGYIVYINDPHEELSTVYNQTYYIDPNGAGRDYYLSVFDSCFPRSNASIITSDPQSGMQLSVTPDACLRKAKLSWTAYRNLADGIDRYDVWLSSDNGSTYQLAGTSTTNSYTVDNLSLNQPYRIFVRVVNQTNTITASSERVNFDLQADESIDFSYIRSVTVKDNHHIEVRVHTSGDTLEFQEITLQRSDDGINFTPIETKPYQTSVAAYQFEDMTADFNKNTYYYQTYLTNSCGLEAGYSNIAHNILLTGKASHLENILNWNNYGIWNGGVSQYRINRRIEGESLFSEIDGTAGTSYFDDVSTLYELGSKFTYYVIADENPNNYGFQDTSASNHVTVEQRPGFYIPNAFTPLSIHNNIFKPMNSFMPNDGTYRFSIFSRQGQMVFHTSDPNAGWDGRLNGKVCPAGVYVYKISYYIPGESSPIIKEGTVTLLY